MNEELKPCVICGGNDIRVIEEKGGHAIKCTCGHKIWCRNSAQMAKRWNVRLSTYICNDCEIPCILKTNRLPETCTCTQDHDAEIVNWKLLEEGK